MKNQRSVLHIIDSLNVGGTEKQCVEMVKRLNSKEYSTHLVTLNNVGPLKDELERDALPLTEFKMTGGYYRPRFLRQVFRLASFMKDKKFDVVQTYGFYSTIPGVMAAKLAHVPVIISGKRDMNELLSRKKIATEKFAWRFCHKIVVNAEMIKTYLVGQEDVKEGKIEVIYNGVETKHFYSMPKNGASQGNVVGMIAVFRAQKDHKTFLNAAKMVLMKRKSVTFALVGSGVLENEMKNYAKQIGVQDAVVFYGRKTGEALLDIFSRFSISVLSSTNEGVPNVILESMSLGIPVIANPSGGVQELIEDCKTGFLFPYKRADVLAEKIISLLDNKKLAGEIGDAGRKKVEAKFSYPLMCSRYTSLYGALLNKVSNF